MNIAFDLDGTLCTDVGDWKLYSKAKPLPGAVEKVNKQYIENTIIIYTSRFEEDRELTVAWLKKYKFKYNRLIMGKFKVDMYVDNLSKRMDEI